MKIETLIHTADGKLEVDDPLLRVGTRGIHIHDPGWRWIITKETIERTKKLIPTDTETRERRTYVRRVDLNTPGRFIGTPVRLRTSNLIIVESNDSRYFETRGY